MSKTGEGSQPRARYVREEEAERHAVEVLRQRAFRIEVARLAAFSLAAIAWLLRGDTPVPDSALAIVAAAAFAVFLVLIVKHRAARHAMRRAEARHALASLGVARLDRDWDELAVAAEAFEIASSLFASGEETEEDGLAAHPYLFDLDIFGKASIRAILGPTRTASGSQTLVSWLTSPADIDEIRGRQEAVTILAGNREAWKDPSVEALLLSPMSPRAWRGFSKWLALPPAFGSEGIAPGWALWFARTLPPVTTVLALVWLVWGTVAWWVWTIPLVIQSVLAFRWGQALTPLLSGAGSYAVGIRGHQHAFGAWEQVDLDGRVGELVASLSSEGGLTASGEVRKLERWLDAADGRGSVLHIFMAAFTLWDVHVAAGLDAWRRRCGPRVGDWFDALGELEALTALATLSCDHPHWVLPEVVVDEAHFEAEGLGHPLIAPSELRSCDVAVDPPGRFLLITGSNMSGKSTLMRSIGVAAVLAQAGSVVCATKLRMSPLRVFTSMRVLDSVTGGVSLFMAELLRLKELVDASRAGDDQPALLYLIDEVLHGTNSEERRVAARTIVRDLLGQNAIGAVTTHDLTLHDDPHLDPASTKVHFRETLEEGDDGDTVTFDYVLRPGLATSRNALRLLRIVGLDPEGWSQST